MGSSTLQKKEKQLDNIISKSKALKSFLRYYDKISISEKELLIENMNLYNDYFKNSSTMPTTGAVKVDHVYFQIITDKYK